MKERDGRCLGEMGDLTARPWPVRAPLDLGFDLCDCAHSVFAPGDLGFQRKQLHNSLTPMLAPPIKPFRGSGHDQRIHCAAAQVFSVAGPVRLAGGLRRIGGTTDDVPRRQGWLGVGKQIGDTGRWQRVGQCLCGDQPRSGQSARERQFGGQPGAHLGASGQWCRGGQHRGALRQLSGLQL